MTEGYVNFHGWRTWYCIVGESEAPGRLPLLCLHGGPGGTHDYLLPLADLLGEGRRVIFYDQLGGGRSDHPRNPALWTVSLFLDELAAVRRALGLTRVHLLGQSWGGMLAMEYALTQPDGLAGIVLADSPASMPLWLAEANRLRAELPTGVQETLLRHEAAGTTGSLEYQDAMTAYYRRHLCLSWPFPDCLARTLDAMNQWPEVYHTMNGPSEFHVIGSLREWDITPRLGEIAVPTLVLGGRYDEATPEITGRVHRGIPGSRWAIFERSAHVPHLEEPDRFRDVVGAFLRSVEEGDSR